MSREIIAHNLKRLRSAAEMTQSVVADLAGMSLSGYQKLERGKADARSESIKAIAKALHASIPELLAEVKPLKEVRFRSLKRLKTREQVIADVVAWLADFDFLENITNQKQEHQIAELWDSFKSFDKENIPEFANHCRKVFGVGNKEPVHDICGLLEARGIKIKSSSIATDAFMGLSVSSNEQGGPAIIINTWQRLPVETWIFSAAHELGHLLMHLGSYDIQALEEDDEQEHEADQFASHFLMPKNAFIREWGETAGLSLIDRVFKVKKVFKVSWRTVLFRYTESIKPEQRNKAWMNFNFAYKVSNGSTLLKHDEPSGVGQEVYKTGFQRTAGREPYPLDQYDFQEDRLPKLVREAVEGGAISLSRGAEILRLPYKDMRSLSANWV
ncbi:MAG: XRE family transcriptional regulator [Pseudomonadota bacterium]